MKMHKKMGVVFQITTIFEQIDLNKVKAIMEKNLSRTRRFETMNNKCCEATSSGP
jgi:hypothetical protein